MTTTATKTISATTTTTTTTTTGLVKAQAELEGLDKILLEAGFDWRFVVFVIVIIIIAVVVVLVVDVVDSSNVVDFSCNFFLFYRCYCYYYCFSEPGCSMCLAMNPDKLEPGDYYYYYNYYCYYYYYL